MTGNGDHDSSSRAAETRGLRLELSPEIGISDYARNAVSDLWTSHFGAAVPPEIAIKFGENRGWATFLAECSQHAPAMLEALDTELHWQEGRPYTDIQAPREAFRSLLGSVEAYRQYRSRHVETADVASPQDAAYLRTHALTEDRGFLVQIPSGYFFFSLKGELKRFSTQLSLTAGRNEPLLLRREVHVNRGQVTSLWLEFPDGELFKPEPIVPGYVIRGLGRMGLHFWNESPSAVYLAAKLEAFQVAHPDATVAELGRMRGSILGRMGQEGRKIGQRSVQVLYYQLRQGKSTAQTGYRHRYRLRRDRTGKRIGSPYPLWGPNRPDNEGWATRIALRSARALPPQSVDDLLAACPDLFWNV